MRKVLLAAGIYHLAFAIWAILWPCVWFDMIGMEHPNHPLLWQGVGLVMGVFGVSLILSAKNPIQHWLIVLTGLGKFTLGIIGFGMALYHREIPLRSIWIMGADDLIWWTPFAAILWACIRAHTGVPPTRSEPFSIAEAAGAYHLSNGKTLAEASEVKLLALVFLRHFGCTFTRQILRGLEGIEKEARQHGAELVLVHMLQGGKETQYLGERSGVPRIADPRCELYRAFGLGKGGFLELFGPQVWWRGAVSIFKGCGVGHLAGDGLQMPGAFLFHQGKIVAAQPAHSASDLPDLPQLFKTLPLPAGHGTVTA
ncbi:MAG: AhpC/TSA family protein [Luteolibacter sp.]